MCPEIVLTYSTLKDDVLEMIILYAWCDINIQNDVIAEWVQKNMCIFILPGYRNILSCYNVSP